MVFYSIQNLLIIQDAACQMNYSALIKMFLVENIIWLSMVARCYHFVAKPVLPLCYLLNQVSMAPCFTLWSGYSSDGYLVLIFLVIQTGGAHNFISIGRLYRATKSGDPYSEPTTLSYL